MASVLRQPVWTVRHLPSGEYSSVPPTGAGAVRCAQGAIPGALCGAEFSASVALGSDVAEPTLLDAAKLLQPYLTPGPQLLCLGSRCLAVTALDPRAA